MFEVKFAITEQLTGSRCPCFGILTLLFALPALAEESDPSISSQPFSGWIAT